jgi:murein DD-endopeptidase MepM/ murein hydrolase activator NlpD
MRKPVNIDKGRFRKFGKIYKEGTHLGHDFDCPEGSSVRAISDGVVIDSRNCMGFGSLNPSSEGGIIFVKHGDIIALYGHVKSNVAINEEVKEGQVIGAVASFKNGNDVLPHLHFGIWGKPTYPIVPYGYSSQLYFWIDPLKYLEGAI